MRNRHHLRACSIFLSLVMGVVPFIMAEEDFSPQGLPEIEQFRVASNLFKAGKYKLSWQAYQIFFQDFPSSELAADAHFMVGESIFLEAVSLVESGNNSDEAGWQSRQPGKIRKTFKKGLFGLKKLGEVIAGEPIVKQPSGKARRVDNATFGEALVHFKKVVSDFSKSGLAPAAQFRLAECRYNRGEYEAALESYKIVLKKYSQSSLIGPARLGIVQCLLALGDVIGAEEGMRILEKEHPALQDDSLVRYARGIIKFQAQKFDDAYESLDAVRNPEAHFYAGKALLQMKKPLLAAGKFRRLLIDFPKSSLVEESSFLRAESYFLSRDYSQAMNDYKKFLAKFPQSQLKQGALYKIGSSHFQKGEYSEARQDFENFIRSNLASDFAPYAQYLIAESYLKQDLLKEAILAYTKVMDMSSRHDITDRAHFRLGVCYLLHKNYVRASDTFLEFINTYSDHKLVPAAHLLRGNALFSLNRYPESIISYQQAVDLDPKTEIGESAMALLLWAHYVQEHYTQITTGYTYLLKGYLPSQDLKILNKLSNDVYFS